MKKRINRLIFSLLAALLSLAVQAQSRVLVLTIDEEIDATAWRNTRGAAAELANGGYDMLLVRLNTYGGAVDMADSIRSALMHAPVETVAFIDHNAASAGALIALSCDSAFMAPGSSIGAATVVNGQGEPMPPKFQSYWSSVMRSTATAHGKTMAEGDSVSRWRRDPELAAAMVDPERALSFTTEEAIEAGLVDGVATSVGDVLNQLGVRDADVKYYEPTFTDRLMGFFGSTAVRAVLIMLILGGIYMEMHTAGLGFAGAVAAVAAVLYFMPMIVAGTLASWVVLLFLIGIVALALEIFVFPGFGVSGVIGIIAMVVALVGAMIHSDSITGIDMSAVVNAIATLLIGAVSAALVVLWLTSKHGPKRFRRITLEKELKTTSGFVGVDMQPAALAGKTGVAVTPLRPAGKVEIHGTIYDATSTGPFIDLGMRVKIERYEAAQLYVRPIMDISE